MATVSPSTTVARPRKKRKLTQSSNSHRYESFSKRIAKLKIDPVHVVQRSQTLHPRTNLSRSHFHDSLEEWTELNLSHTFTIFARKVQPLSESLPQILHHADTIVELLVTHIETRDALSLEPLLSLVAHLARDLGQSFEKYFEELVKSVAQVSASHEDPDVIEWCFTCLAWMFKYLSRLLVYDLRPLLNVMIPYLSNRKEYVRRFAAESLAFLIRKAAVIFPKNPAPLETTLKHLVALFNTIGSDQHSAYEQAFMTLLCESMLGVDAQLHSSAPDIMKCSIQTFLSTEERFETLTRVLEGTLVNLIHQSDAAGFQPILDTFMSVVKQANAAHDLLSVQVDAKMLLVILATRKGTRVHTWNSVLSTILDIGQTLFQCARNVPALLTSIVAIHASAILYAPMSELLPFLERVMDQVDETLNTTSYFTFCDLVAKIDSQRFQELVLPRLQKFVMARWSDDEEGLCLLLRNLQSTNATTTQSGKRGFIAIPAAWEKSITQRISDDKDDIKVFANLTVLQAALRFPQCQEARQNLAETLYRLLDKTLKCSDRRNFQSTFALGTGLQLLLRLKDANVEKRNRLWQQLSHLPLENFRLVPFVEACADLVSSLPADAVAGDEVYKLMQGLGTNLGCDSSSLRKATLSLLRAISKLRGDEWLQKSTDVMLELLDTEYSVGNIRKIAMLVRRFPQLQKDVADQPGIFELIPHFCFGLLPDYHESLRHEVCSALGQMATSNLAGYQIMTKAQDWLQNLSTSSQAQHLQADDVVPRLTRFQCSNLRMIEEVVAKCFTAYSIAEGTVKTLFENINAHQIPRAPGNSRTLALTMLLEMPEVVAKHSKMIVPTFLAMQLSKSNLHVPSSDQSTSTHTLSPEIDDRAWTLRDRKLFLEILSKMNNPKVLYRSTDVKSALLEGLTNGNPDVRRLSLLAILKWKDPGLPQFQQELLKVAEDKNANSDLGLFLFANDEASLLKEEDRTQVLPVLLRLVFGQLVGRSGTHGSQEAKRRTILRMLFRMQPHEINLFLSIALGRLNDVTLKSPVAIQEHLLSRDLITLDQQYGFLRMMLSMLEILQTRFDPYGFTVIDSILYCTTRASHQINLMGAEEIAPALLRNIRKTGLQCLVHIFGYCPNLDWQAYTALIFSELISPRLEKFSIETAQGISGLLRLFAVWAKSTTLFTLLVSNDSRLLGSLWTVLELPSARAEVKRFIIEEIVHPLVILTDEENPHRNDAALIMEKQSEPLLASFVAAIELSPAKDIIQAIASVLPLVASFAASSAASNKLMNTMMLVLKENNQRVPPHLKGQILRAIESLLPLNSAAITRDLKTELYEMVSSYFSYFKDQSNRQLLSRLLRLLAEDSSEHQATEICSNLNAMSAAHLGDVDHDKRLAAFTEINIIDLATSTRRQWLPILHNLLHFAKNVEEFGIRSNAVSSLKRFVMQAAHITDQAALRDLLFTCVLPALKKGVKEDSEVIRADLVVLLGMVIKEVDDVAGLQDMKVLLVGDDDEASFFTNILHIQQHRRLRAIRRLITDVEKGNISALNINDIFLPLLEKFALLEQTEESEQTLRGQSIAAVAILLQWIDWASFRSRFRQNRQDLVSDEGLNRGAIRRLGHAAEALYVASKQSSGLVDGTKSQCYLAKTLPSETIVAEELRSRFIPKLTELSHFKDEGEISLRIPVAVVAIKLTRLLPRQELDTAAAPFVLDISQVLRSRTQETRDLARRTLADVVDLLGPSSMQFALKALRTALTKGYQLHVLSYTLHTILLALASKLQIGDLDYCVQDLVRVIMDDIFGSVGQEKDNQDYVSSMKEVKSSKSFDSMEILAKTTTIPHLPKLLLPFQSLLTGNLTSKQTRHIDELLRRLGVGISHNGSASSQDVLVFAYQLLKESYQQKEKSVTPKNSKEAAQQQRFLVQLDSARKNSLRSAASLLYKVAKFAIDLVRSSFAKQPDLLTPENVHGFLPIIGDALVAAEEDIQVSALRLLSIVIKTPLTELDRDAHLYVTEAVKIIKGSVSMNSELSQAALKVITAILRDRREVDIRDSDIAYLLHRAIPDLEEPDRQGATFNLVKAVMSRELHLPEIYDIIDEIGGMMVTSHSRSSRDAARSIYVHFLLNYPQSQTRWSKQVKFLVKNLEYQYPEGRQSVMEAINTLLLKLDPTTAQDFIATLFMPVILRLANDDNTQCKELAAGLLQGLFRRADEQRQEESVKLLHSWTDQVENLQLVKIGLQAWTVFFGAETDIAESQISQVRLCIARALQQSLNNQSDWELPFCALRLLSTLVKSFPEHVMSAKQSKLWADVRAVLNSDQVWLQSSAADLVEAHLQMCITAGSMEVPLTTPYGLQFDTESVVSILRGFVKALKRNLGNEDLATKTLRNLLFIGRCADASKLTIPINRDVRADLVKEYAEDVEEAVENSDGADTATEVITATQYLLDQISLVLRREPKDMHSAALVPKRTAVDLLTRLLPHLSTDSVTVNSIQALLMPLLYITDPNVVQPRSIDSTFPTAYEDYVTTAHGALEAIQTKLGDTEYTRASIAANRSMRERREERKAKRRIQKVAEPERSAQVKRRKNDRTKERRKEVRGIHRSKRRADLGF